MEVNHWHYFVLILTDAEGVVNGVYCKLWLGNLGGGLNPRDSGEGGLNLLCRMVIFQWKIIRNVGIWECNLPFIFRMSFRCEIKKCSRYAVVRMLHLGPHFNFHKRWDECQSHYHHLTEDETKAQGSVWPFWVTFRNWSRCSKFGSFSS